MKTLPSLLRPALAGALVGLLLTACASERVKAETKKAKANKDDYVDYYPVGSNIPIRIPKDQAKASQAETEEAQRVFREVQQAGVRTPGDPESQAANSSNPGTR